jgi:hypothetical protein
MPSPQAAQATARPSLLFLARHRRRSCRRASIDHGVLFPAPLLQDLAARVAGDELALRPDAAKLATVAARHDRLHAMTAIATCRPAAPDIVIFKYARRRALGGAGRESIGAVRYCIVVVFDLLGLRFSEFWCLQYICTRGQEPSQELRIGDI